MRASAHAGTGDLAAEAEVRIPLAPFVLEGALALPGALRGMVLVPQGRPPAGVRRLDLATLRALHEAGLGTLRVGLLSPDEGRVDDRTPLSLSDIHLLAGRLVVATDWIARSEGLSPIGIGYLASGALVPVALLASAARPLSVKAVAARSGDPRAARPALPSVTTPALLIVDRDDERLLEGSRAALDALPETSRLEAVSAEELADDEPTGRVAGSIRDWFLRFLSDATQGAGSRDGAFQISEAPL